MLTGAALDAAVLTLGRTAVSGPWSRVIGYHLLQGPPPGAAPGSPAQPLWPGGPPANGARYTPKGTFGTIYLASDPLTALAEVSGVFTNPTLPPTTPRLPPWAVFAVEGVVTEVLDLTDSSIQAALNTNFQELTGDWQVQQGRFVKGIGPIPPTQELGQAAFASGVIRGIKYPSARVPNTGLGYAIFADRLAAPDNLTVYDPRNHLNDRRP